MKSTGNSRAPGQAVIYACSGASDAGELADHTARALAQRGLAQMSCLAGIAGRVKPLLITAQNASHIIVVDGCPLNCARHTLDRAGLPISRHLELHRLGFRKGKCQPTKERVALAVQAGTALIQSLEPREP